MKPFKVCKQKPADLLCEGKISDVALHVHSTTGIASSWGGGVKRRKF